MLSRTSLMMTVHKIILNSNAMQVHGIFDWSAHSRMIVSLALFVFSTDIISVGMHCIFQKNIRTLVTTCFEPEQTKIHKV